MDPLTQWTRALQLTHFSSSNGLAPSGEEYPVITEATLTFESHLPGVVRYLT